MQVNKLSYMNVKKMSFIQTVNSKPIKLFKEPQDIKQSFIWLNLPPTFTLFHTQIVSMFGAWRKARKS